jgi:hypothetical protein
VCRRQGSLEIESIVRTLAERGLRLHGFGVKATGLRRFGDVLVSADSMAWSARGRREPGCAPGHRSEANCLPYALAWRRTLVDGLASGSRRSRQRLSACSRPRRRPASRTNASRAVPSRPRGSRCAGGAGHE